MKKMVVLVIVICFAAIVAASIAIISCEENCVLAVIGISKIVLQSTLTGIVTFSGLLFTLLSQEQRHKTEKEAENCPSIAIQSLSPPSGEIKTDTINANHSIICCTKESTI